jgi:hypothetical protein
MGSYDPLAFLVFIVAIVIGAFALALEREGRPKWQPLTLIIMVVCLCILSAMLINLGRKPYILRASERGFFIV